MSEARIGELEERIQQEEKRFLMEKYVSMLLLQIKPSDGDGEDVPLDDQTVRSLQVARPYVGLPLGEQIAELLRAEGHEVDELEVEDDSFPEVAADGVDYTDVADVDGRIEPDAGAGLFDDDSLGDDGESPEGGESETLFDDAEETDADGDADEIVAEGETEGLFDDEDDDGAVAVGAADGAGADNADDIGLFDDETTSADDNGQRGEAATEVTGDEEADGEEPTEEDENAGVLFGSDIYSGVEGSGRPDKEDTPGFEPGEEQDAEQTPGFTPTEGHEVEETPGFTPTEGHEVEEPPASHPPRDTRSKQTPGLPANAGTEAAAKQRPKRKKGEKDGVTPDADADNTTTGTQGTAGKAEAGTAAGGGTEGSGGGA